MIFYFTGTGNSLFAAKRLLNEGEELVSIAEAVKNERYEYTVEGSEAVGFVFPVYFYTVPTFVKDFVSRLKLTGAEYVYAVITCGGSIRQAGNVLKGELKKRNIELNYLAELLMPDNSMLFYQIPAVDKAEPRLNAADEKLKAVKDIIEKRLKKDIGSGTILADMVGGLYKMSMSTKKFMALDELCIGCGMCERNCPEQAIKLENGRPVWVKDKCCKCSACINRCPRAAIQYGRATVNRNRYVNPEL